LNHFLKCWPEYFQAVKDGIKDFELRTTDRGFKVGDTIELMEWNPEKKDYTGRNLPARTINYILEGGSMGLPSNVCILNMRNPEFPIDMVPRSVFKEELAKMEAAIQEERSNSEYWKWQAKHAQAKLRQASVMVDAQKDDYEAISGIYSKLIKFMPEKYHGYFDNFIPKEKK